jgi:transposase
MTDSVNPSYIDLRHEIALFRYGLIADVVYSPPSANGLYRRLIEKAAMEYRIPGTTRTRVSAETLRCWLRLYQKGGFSALLPKLRSDRGKLFLLTPALKQALEAQYRDHPEWKVRVHYRNLVAGTEEDEALRPLPSYNTICRYMHALNYHRKQYSKPAKKLRTQLVKDSEKELLETWRRSKDKRLWERAVTILENGNQGVQQIATKIERPVSVVQGWITKFNSYGIDGIRPRPITRTPDRRVLASKVKEKRLIEILHDRPSSFGINRSNWNLAALASAYEHLYSESISRSNVSTHIRRAGYGLRKAKKVLTSPDPNYREKVELVLRTLQTLQPEELFFFIDEMGPIRVRKYGGRMYSKRTSTPSIPQVQSYKGSVTLSGALCATSNQVTWIYGKSKNTSAMIDLIEVLFNQYNDASAIYVTWDAASWHDSVTLNEWLDNFNGATTQTGSGPIIYLVPLPTSSQFLDVIESIFSGMKRAVIHHSDYESNVDMKTAISGHFRERNEFFGHNPKRVGKKIWEQEFFSDFGNLPSGNYREW